MKLKSCRCIGCKYEGFMYLAYPTNYKLFDYRMIYDKPLSEYRHRIKPKLNGVFRQSALKHYYQTSRIRRILSISSKKKYRAIKDNTEKIYSIRSFVIRALSWNKRRNQEL